MLRKIFLGVLILGAVAGSSAHAAVRFSSGDLTVQIMGTPPCAGLPAALLGQQIQLTGSGYLAGTPVQIEFGCCGDTRIDLGTVNADGSGNLDTVVTVPGTIAVPELAEIEANGLAPKPNTRRSLSALVLIGSGSTTDGDSDGYPDFCDNCPAMSNPGQEDADTDDVGDVCDPCPFDFRNDADGDGLCEDVDVCPLDANNDVDGDGVCGDEDNCPDIANPFQTDTDKNGIGDDCQVSPTCSDGVDNDRDGRTDFPSDKGCDDASDTTETSVAIPCDDGIDNDGDGIADFRPNLTRDPGCGFDTGSTTAPENPECDDGIDNDGDGFIDWDGHIGESAPDPECQGFGFGTSETVPEPSLSMALAIGVLGIAAVSSSFRLS